MKTLKKLNLQFLVAQFILISIAPSSLYAQKAVLFDWRDGLSANSVKAIVKDKDGYLWLGTDKGIIRFDGYQFLRFNEENSDSAKSFKYPATVMFCDSKNRIWIGNGRGASYFNKKSEKFYKIPISRFPVKTHIRGFCEDNRGKVFICGDDGFFEFNEKTDSINPLFSTNGPLKFDFEINWRNIAFDAIRNGIWIGTSNAGLKFWDINKRKLIEIEDIFTEHKKNPLKVPISFVKTDEYNNLWFAQSRRAILYSLDLKTGKLKTFRTKGSDSYDHYLLSLTGNVKQRIWLAGRGYGIFYLDYGDSVVQNFTKNYGVAYVSCTDNMGNVWMGTSRGILCINYNEDKINRYNMSFLEREYEFPQMTVKTDHEQNIIISSSNKGFFKYMVNKNNFKNIVVSSDDQSSNNIYSYNIDDNQIYASTWNNAFIQNKEGKFQPIFNANSEAFKIAQNKVVLQIIPFANGEWLMNIKENGIFHLSSKGQILNKTKDKNLPVNEFKTMLLLADGSLLAGTDIGGGLIWLNKDLSLKRYWKMSMNKDSLNAYSFRSIYRDLLGRIWLCTYGGVQLLNLKSGKIKSIKNTGIPEGQCAVFYEDKKYIYLNTPTRIIKTDKKTLTVSGNINCKSLGAIGFTGYAALSGSNIWVVADNELLKIDTSYFFKNRKTTPFHISALKVFGDYKYKCLNQNDIKLDYKENNFTIDFTDLDYTSTYIRFFNYKLEGFEKTWNSSKKPSISYTNVSPGNYTLLLKVINENGIENIYKFNIEIIPPWWKTLWAKIVFIALTLFIVGLGIKLFINQKLKKQKIALEKIALLHQERLRISAELHDDMGSELTSIRLISELIKKKNNEGTIDITENINIISETSNHLVDKMNQIVWALNPENDQSQSLISYLRQYLTKYFDKNLLSFKIYIPDPMPLLPVNAEKRQQIFLAVKEIAHNIVKHAKATFVEVKINVENNHLYIEIKDDGKTKINYSELLNSSNGNGLKNIRRRVESLGGNFNLNYKQGTIAIISIKMS